MVISRHIALATWLLTVLLLSGCAPGLKVGSPAPAELERVRTGELTVVLFQVEATRDGKPLSPPLPADGNLMFRFYLANLEELAAPERISPSSASAAAAGQGWRHLLLSPGSYYLLILPPGMEQNPPAVAFHAPSARFGRLTRYSFSPGRAGFWAPEMTGFVFSGPPPPDFEMISGFWFQVPRNTAGVYLGSVSTDCIGGRGLLGSLIDSCSELVVSSKPEAAQQIFASMVPQAGPLTLAPLLPNGMPRAGTRLRELGTTDIILRGPAELKAAYTGAELAPWSTFHGVGQSAGILNLFAILAESATRAGAEKEATLRGAQTMACTEALASTLATFDYAAQLVPTLEQAGLRVASPTPAGTAARVDNRLAIDVPILQLRQSGSPDHLALELGISVRLESADGEDVLYRSVLFHAADYPVQVVERHGLRAYGRLVPERPQPRPLTQWCGREGVEVLKGDIERGLQYIAAQIARDLD